MITVSPSSVRVDATGLLTFKGPANSVVDWFVGNGNIVPLGSSTNSNGYAWALFQPGMEGSATVEVTYVP